MKFMMKGFLAAVLWMVATGAVIAKDGVHVSVQVSTNINVQTESSGSLSPIRIFPPLPPGYVYHKSVVVNPSRRPYMGLFLRDLTEQLAGFFKVEGGGVLVESVAPGGPAQTAGLLAGDVVTAFNQTAVNACSDIFSQLDKHKPSDGVTLTIYRHGEKQERKLTLAENPTRAGTIAIPRVEDTRPQEAGAKVRQNQVDINELLRTMTKAVPPMPTGIDRGEIEALKHELKQLQQEIQKLRTSVDDLRHTRNPADATQ